MTTSRSEIVGDASLASGSTFGLELIDEIDGGEEAPGSNRRARRRKNPPLKRPRVSGAGSHAPRGGAPNDNGRLSTRDV
jgi:hypothetical protein